ncbi:PREDICTED: phosphatidylinositol-glycan biosynthesis class W protein-like isoform X2 [Priapulus caudatus]|uniref:Phosphatidylinositol-glycan biosynthesis class W protein n=1 Tax=Priapulus caudatus TaxID=37621 RepID=A0ABM1EBX8_PRICU|nr:PREDICTED: phosphatidylinositol-glycan biosynthesis class W protein-like isoform X2 [Priapulus caudatus]
MSTFGNASYTKLREEYVSKRNGTTVYENNLVFASVPIGTLLCALLIPWFCNGSRVNTTIQTSVRFAVAFFCLVLPPLLCCTMFADHLEGALTSFVCACVGLLVFGDAVVSRRTERRDRGDGRKERAKSEVTPRWKHMMLLDMKGRRAYICWSRAAVNLGSAIAILAYDFAIFPGRFGKTEVYGTGLMDHGVGGFIISHAIVCSEATEVARPAKRGSPCASLVKAAKSSIPLLMLGLARLIAIKTIGYHEHVTEYGVHWNFFLTLSVVKIACAGIFLILPPKMSGIFALVLSVLYQYLLINCGLADFLKYGSDGTDSRETLIDANREGLVSCIGYIALYFAGVQLGRILMKPRQYLRDFVVLLIQLNIVTAVLYVCMQVLSGEVEAVSRKMANLAFVVWTIIRSQSGNPVCSVLSTEMAFSSSCWLTYSPDL